jgi:hypothetical protein
MLFFYASPLQKIKTVLNEKDACTIHAPTTILTIANTGFWTFYGISISEVVMIIPNTAGLAPALIQAVLLLKYPSKCGGNEDEETRPLVDNQRDEENLIGQSCNL